jgi:hypothetical protein
MPNLSVKAAEIDDPGEMLRRIAYRNHRIITRTAENDDPAAFAKNMASRTRSDIRHLANTLGVELDETNWT